jgi:tetratricopeptide (TPR) repeat protein
MKDQVKNRNRIMSILTLGSLLLIIWEMFIFRKTFISFLIPLSILIVGGLIAFIALKDKIKYYNQNEHSVYLQAIHGIILFGGLLMFAFMGANYYFVNHKEIKLNLKVEETGRLARGRRGCGNPYAMVNYNNTQKQLIFPCNVKLENCSSVKVALKEGLFGFVVIKNMIPLNCVTNGEKEDEIVNFHKEYMKILSKAEEHYQNGNIEKSIELYERAASLNPDDKLPKLRLEEIRNKNTTNTQ